MTPIGLATRALLFLGTGLAAQAQDFDITSQIGPDPVLPDPVYVSLAPDLNVAEVVGWAEGQMPEVP